MKFPDMPLAIQDVSHAQLALQASYAVNYHAEWTYHEVAEGNESTAIQTTQCQLSILHWVPSAQEVSAGLTFWPLKVKNECQAMNQVETKWGNKLWAKWACEDKYVWVARLFLQLRKPSNFLPSFSCQPAFNSWTSSLNKQRSTCWSSDGSWRCSCAALSICCQLPLLGSQAAKFLPLQLNPVQLKSARYGSHSAPRITSSGWELLPSGLKSRWKHQEAGWAGGEQNIFVGAKQSKSCRKMEWKMFIIDMLDQTKSMKQVMEAYILKVQNFADPAFQPQKICGKSA